MPEFLEEAKPADGVIAFDDDTDNEGEAQNEEPAGNVEPHAESSAAEASGGETSAGWDAGAAAAW